MLRVTRSSSYHVRYYSVLPKVSHITTPIFYPNAKPHLGHLYSSLLCDVFHRWNKLNGTPSLLTTGTDEHGLKIQAASEKNGFSDPKLFVDKLYKEFVSLDTVFNIDFTRFIRTTDPDHIENVKLLWELCEKNGFIYQGTHNGWYSISDETFYPETKVIKDPKNKGKYINTESNNEVIYQSEVNYFFKLSQFRNKLIDHISNNEAFIYPASKRTEILNELKNTDLSQDLSISRPSSRLKWGIEVPGDSTQRIYVWFDALCNYVTSIGGIQSVIREAPLNQTPLQHKINNSTITPNQWWCNTTHLIGKDIARFHCIYWPSFLMAAGLPLPKQVVVHNHWLCNGVKMSKSLGNVVDPIEMADKYGADVVRWFLLENSKLDEDGDFQEDKVKSLRGLLVSKWGNLINRCCAKKFSINRAVNEFNSEGQYNLSDKDFINSLFENSETNISTDITKLITELNDLPQFMNEKIEHFHPGLFLRKCWSIINDANTLMQNGTPWNKNGLQQDALIFVCMEVSRILAILCQPMAPELTHNLLDFMNVDKDKRTLQYARIGFDQTYGKSCNTLNKGVPIARTLNSEA
ncbi:hypothetical protein NCAS_0A06980 [Naumovozyma castellii]|uniref:Methionine--tRNA ligase, mitochondrial n=1 Tax=Naumovozyma castellii TaxID=27288 RepID=G0V708_NAUCA|nr:hypothetical protein NCAS_0A06980 [Naumovozyma castellii CBS 4309]CCC67256.1 hypothetical protein NCAS_0A06980 [Naumovozyma castellii CBS 4309]